MTKREGEKKIYIKKTKNKKSNEQKDKGIIIKKKKKNIKRNKELFNFKYLNNI